MYQNPDRRERAVEHRHGEADDQKRHEEDCMIGSSVVVPPDATSVPLRSIELFPRRVLATGQT
jgi:thiamine phosphate synthase YjbQ (UPF0047 family)